MELLKLLVFAKIHVEDETLSEIYFYRKTRENNLEFTIFRGKEPDGIAVSIEMYQNVLELAQNVPMDEEGFQTIDLDWAGRVVTSDQ